MGVVTSPQTWVVLCALSRVESAGLFPLVRAGGVQYAAPDVAYADDLLSFAASLEGLQAKADMISLSSSILGLIIATSKLRVFKCCGESPQRQKLAETLILYGMEGQQTPVQVQSTGHIKCLGVLYDLDYSGGAQFAASCKLTQAVLRIVTRKHASPDVAGGPPIEHCK